MNLWVSILCHFIISLQEANVAAVQTATKKPWKETGRNQKKKVLNGSRVVIFIFFWYFQNNKPMPITYNLCIRIHVWDLKMTPFSHRGQLQEARRISARTTERTLKERQKRLEELRQKQTETCPANSPGLHGFTKTEHEWKWRIRWGRFSIPDSELNLEKVFVICLTECWATMIQCNQNSGATIPSFSFKSLQVYSVKCASEFFPVVATNSPAFVWPCFNSIGIGCIPHQGAWRPPDAAEKQCTTGSKSIQTPRQQRGQRGQRGRGHQSIRRHRCSLTWLRLWLCEDFRKICPSRKKEHVYLEKGPYQWPFLTNCSPWASR